MRILVTGSAGMLGESIKKVFKDDDLICTDKKELDVASYDSVMDMLTKLNNGVDYIFHRAAETDLEYCEKWPAQAYYTNTIGTMNMLKLAGILKIPIVYMSTAGVFLGEKVCYFESDKPEPVNHYGRSKWYGELAIRTYPKQYIFRMSWAMGGGPSLDKKFVNKIYKQIQSGTKVIYAINDVYGSPTYDLDVARTIKACLEDKQHYGIYHVAGIGKASRYDVAKAMVEIMNLKIEVVPVSSAHFRDTFPCPRARSEVLVSEKNFPSQMRDWRESLREYLEAYYA